MSGHEIVYEELPGEDPGSYSKAVSAPTGKVIAGVGYRFRDGSGNRVPVEVVDIVPFGTDGTRWVVTVNAPVAGTLRVYATCIDA